MLEKTVADVTTKTVSAVEKGLRKIWTLLDAATQKEKPSETLSEKAIQSIQGEVPNKPG